MRAAVSRRDLDMDVLLIDLDRQHQMDPLTALTCDREAQTNSRNERGPEERG